MLDPADLTEKTCKLCGNPPIERPTEHFYLELSQFQDVLTKYAEKAQGWKVNAIHLTQRFLDEGLQDRAATRDLTWGVEVPIEGFDEKKIYVWIEAVSGYLSASKQWTVQAGGSWESFWSDEEKNLTAYYVHGKDNIPFHTLIWPALLLGVGGLHLPDRIISCEYMTQEGKKFSTSRNWAVWVPDILKRYQPDSIRYFLIANGPEKRDTEFHGGNSFTVTMGSCLVRSEILLIERWPLSTNPLEDAFLQGSLERDGKGQLKRWNSN